MALAVSDKSKDSEAFKEPLDPVVARRERLRAEREERLQAKEDARVEVRKHDIEVYYWTHVQSIFLNGIECLIKRVDAVGGAMNVQTGRGEIKAWGGDFVVSMPDGSVVVMSAVSVRMLDLASGAVHLDENGNEIPVPFGYPNFVEDQLDPTDEEKAEYRAEMDAWDAADERTRVNQGRQVKLNVETVEERKRRIELAGQQEQEKEDAERQRQLEITRRREAEEETAKARARQEEADRVAKAEAAKAQQESAVKTESKSPNKPPTK